MPTQRKINRNEVIRPLLTEKQLPEIQKVIEKVFEELAVVPSKEVPDNGYITLKVKILLSDRAEIDKLREKYKEKPYAKKIGISLQDWITAAIKEKIYRDSTEENG